MERVDIKCRRCGKKFYYVTDDGTFKCRSCGNKDKIEEIIKELNSPKNEKTNEKIDDNLKEEDN